MLCLFISETFLFVPGWPESHFVTKNDLKLLTFLALSPSAGLAGVCHHATVASLCGSEA